MHVNLGGERCKRLKSYISKGETKKNSLKNSINKNTSCTAKQSPNVCLGSIHSPSKGTAGSISKTVYEKGRGPFVKQGIVQSPRLYLEQ